MKSYRLAALAILLAGATVGLLAALGIGGAAVPPHQLDPGPIARWGLPIAGTLSHLAAAAMLGSLVFALFALRRGTRHFGIALDTASVGAAVFTVSTVVAAGMSLLATLTPRLLVDRSFGEQLAAFLLDRSLGRAWLITVLMGAMITLLAIGWRTWTGTLVTAGLAAASFLPLAMQGHLGVASGHDVTVNATLLYNVGAAVWLGSLMLLVIVRPADEGRTAKTDAEHLGLTILVARYSSLALAAVMVVAVSGIARTVVALGDGKELLTPYGLIVLGTAVVLLALVLLEAWNRHRLIRQPSSERQKRSLWKLILVELSLWGLAVGAEAVLARTPRLPGDEPPAAQSAAQRLTQAPLPPELTLERWVTSYDVDILWMVVVGFAVILYVAGVLRLHRRGLAWPVPRTISWLSGMLVLLWVTCGPLSMYRDYLFSMHMAGQMMLTMAVPLLLVSGAPITLALRTIHPREDGSRGAREWILWVAHSRFSRFIMHPLVAAGVLVASLWLYYFTDLVRWSMYVHIGQEWMLAHFLISGCLFAMTLIGIDPFPCRLPRAGRLVTLVAVIAVVAVFGMVITMQNGLIVAEWFGSMGRTWGATPMEDQRVGGGIAWVLGGIPLLIMAIMVAIQRSRTGSMPSRRDRRTDRSGGVEVQEYNAKLARLSRTSRQAP